MRTVSPRRPAKRRADDLAQHRRWLKRADAIAHAPISAGGSPHPSVQVGAVLVDSKGKEILYVTLEPCAVCAGLAAEMGVKMVCVPVGSLRRYARLKSKWKASIEIGLIKLTEAGVPLVAIDMD